ncbi:MAG: amidohydrolase [Deltaproteobacteria bacterium]|jgi:amidohydrolase|nr:amidohydrolase [Deltaproteobacteria bacterium]
MVNLKELIQKRKNQIVGIRRELHQIPEPAYTEQKTSAAVADHLKKAGLEVRTGVARYGVVGLLRTEKPGPTLMIRADMDALPVTEQTGLPFSSTHAGAMHACGHDAHMAMVLGAALVLSQMKDRLKGNIKFIFQPAEEGPGGAKPMIEEGVMENPKVDYAVGCHLWPGSPEGTIGVKAGTIMAAMNRFDIRIIGSEGHGAMPHLCVDALEVGTQVVNALQRIVSRHMNPLKPTVVSIGAFHAGKAFNIIPGEAELSGTTRTFDLQVWNTWESRMTKILQGVCDSMGARFELKFDFGYPPTTNDAFMADLVRQCAQEVVGSDKVVEPEPTMGGEDMSYYLQRAKGCFFFIGVGRPAGAPLHNARFDFNEAVLLLGVETYCRIALGLPAL